MNNINDGIYIGEINDSMEVSWKESPQQHNENGTFQNQNSKFIFFYVTKIR